MLILGIDFETTGLNSQTDRVTEIGAVLWDTSERKPLAVLSEMVYAADYPRLSAEITDLTGITQSALETFGKPPAVAFTKLIDLSKSAEACVAHNAPFDRGFLAAELGRLALVFDAKIPWIDTSADLPFSKKITTRKLVHLAAEHGFVNPFAHRAAFDVLTMLKILDAYDIQEVIKLSLEPNITLLANTAPPWSDQGRSTDLAKARGYRWDGSKKRWHKIVKKSQVEREQSHGEFPVVEAGC